MQTTEMKSYNIDTHSHTHGLLLQRAKQNSPETVVRHLTENKKLNLLPSSKNLTFLVLSTAMLKIACFAV